MRNNKKVLSFLSILFSVLLIAQNCPVAEAKGGGTLKLDKSRVELSVIDPSKNLLRVLDAVTEIVVKPTKKTQANATGVKIAVKGGKADLSELGPANLLRSGTYTITAKRGKKKLKATVQLDTPKLITGKLQVPLADKDGSVKARILRHQEVLEAGGIPIEETPEISANFSLLNENHEPIEVGGELLPTLAVPGNEAFVDLNNDGTPESTVHEFTYITEIPPSAEDQIKYPVISATFNATTASRETQQFEYNAIPPLDEASEGSQVVTNVEVTAQTTTSEHQVTALVTKIEESAPDVEIAYGDLKEVYNTCNEIAEPIELAGQTPDTQIAAAEAAYAVGVNDLYEAIANTLVNVDGLEKDIVGEISGEISFKSGEIATGTAIIEPSQLEETSFNTFCSGYFDSSKIPENLPPPPVNLEAKVYASDANVIVGSLTLPEDPKERLAAVQAGTFPESEFNEKAVAKLEKYAKAFKEGNFDAIPQDIKDGKLPCPIPSGVLANLAKIAGFALTALQDKAGFSIDAAPGCFAQGDPGQFQFKAPTGVFMDPDAALKAVFVANDSKEHQYPPGFVPSQSGENGELTTCFIPKITGGGFSQGNFGIYNGTKNTESLANIFALNTGRSDLALGAPEIPSLIQTFDPSKDGAALTSAFEGLGSNASKFFSGGTAGLFASAINFGTPTGSFGGPTSSFDASSFSGIFNIANSFAGSFKPPENIGALPAIGLGDVFGHFGGQPSDTGAGSTGTPTGGFDFGIFTNPTGTFTGTPPPGGFPTGTFTGTPPPGSTPGLPPGGFPTGAPTTGFPTGTFDPTHPPTTGDHTGTFTGTMPPPTGTMPPPTGTMPPPTTGTGDYHPPEGSFMPPPTTTAPLPPPPTETYVAPPPTYVAPPPTYVAPPPTYVPPPT